MFSVVLIIVFSIANLTTTAEPDQANPNEVVQPYFFGEENKVEEIELGQNLTIECKAFFGCSDTTLVEMYWVQVKQNKEIQDSDDDKFFETCEKMIFTTCETNMIKMNQTCNVFASTKLYLINIREDNVKYNYNCKMDTPFGSKIKIYTLKIKEKKSDISQEVFIPSITCSICIVLLVIVCVLLRIDIVLLYRSITGKDETIADGKEYDAYVSCVYDSSNDVEERSFALQNLPNILENYFGYKLCFLERDIIPGGSTVDDMDSYLEKCRRLIILLSKNYISDRAMYELESGMHKAMVERKIKVIVIEFTSLNERIKVMPDSLKLLKASSRVKWRKDQSFSVKSRFWKKIRYLMPAKPFKPKMSYSCEC
ncbi:interleukin-18 receptor 1-like [Pelobates fuscus]|uniref:interleukin-18 receptor 1-like n=1 Tax=Pelobates fuscus TaxID=191477 RepID=UPI002FE4D2BD